MFFKKKKSKYLKCNIISEILEPCCQNVTATLRELRRVVIGQNKDAMCQIIIKIHNQRQLNK